MSGISNLTSKDTFGLLNLNGNGLVVCVADFSGKRCIEVSTSLPLSFTKGSLGFVNGFSE